MNYLWYGIFYSFLGWGLEKLFAAATGAEHRLRRCFVVLPLCPVYGLAMLAVLALGTQHLPHLWERMTLGAFAATAVEYAVHWGYETLFAVRFWDYSHTRCDVNGRVCLPFSLCWGALSALALRWVQPELERIAARLPDEAAALALFFITLDGILTCRVLLTTHDIDALRVQTLLPKRRRTA